MQTHILILVRCSAYAAYPGEKRAGLALITGVPKQGKRLLITRSCCLPNACHHAIINYGLNGEQSPTAWDKV